MKFIKRNYESTKSMTGNDRVNLFSDLTTMAGGILAVSYPILALSTGTRAVYQLFFKEGVSNYLAPTLSAVAATCYLLATIGFVYRRRWTWWLSVSVLAFESSLTLIVGGLSFIYPEVIGSTVWRHFGADYAYFPLVQPLLGLIWLFRPETMRLYEVKFFSRLKFIFRLD